MPLVLEIEYLLGVAFAARGPDSAEPDWPPQPDRVFSALVAAWAAHGEAPEERTALEWLERQPPPLIQASAAAVRPAPASYVPPNDKLQATANVAWRTRQPRRFPAALPHDPVVRLVWPDVHDAPLDALSSVGREVAYVGHSASLTRCAFRIEAEARPAGRPARRRIYRGRLRELELAFAANRRPSPGAAVVPLKPPEPTPVNAFSPNWLTFEIVSGRLDLRAAAPACKALIKTIMSGYESTAGRGAVPAWVSGHEADGAPTKDPHLAAVPLAYAGFEHADGTLMGLALVPPHGRGDLLADAGFRRALAQRATDTDDEGRHLFNLTLGSEGKLGLALTLGAEGASLDSARYMKAARYWATVTPMVLDRHLKGGSAEDVQDEMETIIAEACERSAGAKPSVVASKHSAVRGALSAYPSGKGPCWTGWRVPEHFTSRRLVHAVIDFGSDVRGPLLIGAGRFCGLGLCLPLDQEHR